MRMWLAAYVAVGMTALGCGGGHTANGNVAPKITSTPPTTATVGVPFNYTVSALGMTPMGFTVVSGPDDFMVHPTSGVVTWIPQSEGVVAIEVSAKNLAGTDRQAFEVSVEGLSGPVFTTEPPTEATVAAPYAYDPSVVANGAVSWSAPVAPSGLTIDPDTGAVRWTPTSAEVGPQDLTIRATERGSGAFADQSFVVTVEDTGGPAVITSTPPERVYAGETLRYDATASGAPTIRWTVEEPSSGTPAPGVNIVTTPPEGPAVTIEWDTSSIAAGDYSIAIQVDNGLGGPNVQEFVVTVDPRPPVPEIDLVTVPPPASMFVGTVYNYDVNLTPQSESSGVTWSLVGATVPADLAITIDPATGEVSFTASEANGELSYSYTVRAENVLAEADEETISVDAVHPPATPILTVTPGTVFALEIGEAFPGASATATGQPAPVLAIVGTLPDFVDFDPLTGLLSASASNPVPTENDIGAHTFDIVATNSEGMDSATIDITVVAAPPSVDSITPAAGRRQSDVPVVVRGSGFVGAATPVIRLELGAYSETLTTVFVDESTLTATVPVGGSRPSGVYDVVVDQGSATTLAKRFTVTEGDGSTLSGSIGADVTLTAIGSPHVVTRDLRIENGATVTIEPGAVVMFVAGTNRRIDVGANSAGAMRADGGEPGVGDQIVFTRFQAVGGPAPSGHYRGLRFGANLIAAATLLRNVVVEFGGRRNTSIDQGAVEAVSGSAPEVRDTIIRESLNYGLFAHSGAGSDTTDWFSGNQLTANGRAPINIGSDDVSTLGSNLALTGNGEDRIFVRGSTVSRATADWANHGVPFYLSKGIFVRGGSVMSVAPGTEMRFATSRRLQVSSNTEPATLVASGTPEAPIRMVSDNGTWDGVLLESLIQAGTVLRNVRMEGLGAAVNGGLRIDNPGNPGDRIAIVESCLIESSEPGSVGVNVHNRARVSSFQNNVLDVDGLSVSAAMRGFGDVLGPSNTYEAPLRVRGGTISGADMVWTKPLASDSSTQPIRPTGSLTVTDGSLTIEAGNRIEMPVNGQLAMIDSRLAIDGTESEPVVFTPVSGAAYWNRIRVRGSGSSGVSRMTHAVLEAAGSGPTLDPASGRAAIVVEANGGVPAMPAISDTTITNSNGYGMAFANSTHCRAACNDNTIVGSRFSAVRMYANFIGRFGAGNTLAGNNVSATPGHEGVWVLGDTVDTTATWPDNDVPYVVQGNVEIRRASPAEAPAVLTIEPGTELRFASGRRLRVGDGNDGALDARGTSAQPITFTSIDTVSPVFWRGIDFNQGSNGSVLDWVVVSHGGSGADTGNVNFRTGSAVTVGVVDFTHSVHYAAVIYSGSAPMFTGASTDRVYMLNGQQSNPGPGDPAFDCVRDVAASTCTQP
ncbi:MAG: putative Ig domain-containing protein [Deltaproteobacteria bacterium]|nr:putative Ig domain-containing protein [Deltaproteobacteria bacterium]